MTKKTAVTRSNVPTMTAFSSGSRVVNAYTTNVVATASAANKSTDAK